jgi:hypothetical protein
MTIDEICTAILYVPHVELDESAAQKLIEAIKSRIEVSNFRHTDLAITAIESLEDAATCMYVAHDDMRDAEPELDGFRTIEPRTLDQVVSV